jgi:hypothetical protein
LAGYEHDHNSVAMATWQHFATRNFVVSGPRFFLSTAIINDTNNRTFTAVINDTKNRTFERMVLRSKLTIKNPALLLKKFILMKSYAWFY